MSMHGPYTFTNGKGETFKVEVIIDPHKIAQALAQKAYNSSQGITTACSGGVMVKLEEV
jgi:hypothetical protein